MKRKVNLHRANKPVARSGSQLRQSDHQYHPDGRKRICCMLRSPESGPPESREEHDVSGQQHAAELLRLTWWQHRWMFCSLLGKHWYMISEYGLCSTINRAFFYCKCLCGQTITRVEKLDSNHRVSEFCCCFRMEPHRNNGQLGAIVLIKGIIFWPTNENKHNMQE